MIEMLQKKVWAVVGATGNPEKYGYQIMKSLMDQGYDVYPVNPNYETIEGVKCYPSLSACPENPEAVDVVISPDKALALVDEVLALGVEYLWFQPGTFDGEVMKKTASSGLKTVYGPCVMVALREGI
ncbi:MAG: CoA-binding protein [delta proteobacterium ML8_F1]|nr:MAG: CoA-binding protein [delta proteobacterium ML8_F1]